MIPPVYPCGTTRYVQNMIKIREWVKNEISALNLLCIGLSIVEIVKGVYSWFLMA